MDFHEEFTILSQHPTPDVLEIRFRFNAQTIRLFYTNSDNHQFLVLICETDTATVIKNMPFYEINKRMHINGYWGESYDHIKNYLLDTNFKLTTFYDHVRDAIKTIGQAPLQNLPHFEVQQHTLNDGLHILQTLKDTSTEPGKAIYFNHVRRVKMSDGQRTKVKQLLGKDAAAYLVSLELTAVFTSDITRQRQLILEEST